MVTRVTTVGKIPRLYSELGLTSDPRGLKVQEDGLVDLHDLENYVYFHPQIYSLKLLKTLSASTTIRASLLDQVMITFDHVLEPTKYKSIW